ncbi:hypothetical protein BME24068_06209 [Burkholderia metallica]|nr:hypothetical protein BME24068_06209 [Burkholderia metallica]
MNVIREVSARIVLVYAAEARLIQPNGIARSSQ